MFTNSPMRLFQIIFFTFHRALRSMSRFEKMLLLDPIYFECVRQGNAKKLKQLLNMTSGLACGVTPDDTFKVGSYDRPVINLAIEAGHTNVGKYLFYGEGTTIFWVKFDDK